MVKESKEGKRCEVLLHYEKAPVVLNFAGTFKAEYLEITLLMVI